MDKNNNTQPGWLLAVVTVTLINGVVTGLHFVAIFMGLIPIKGEMASVIEIATGDIVVSVIPSFVAVYGLWRKKYWAWALAFLVAGSYLHGQFVLLGRFFMHAQLGSMSLISIYFILFNLTMIYLLWRHRDIFE